MASDYRKGLYQVHGLHSRVDSSMAQVTTSNGVLVIAPHVCLEIPVLHVLVCLVCTEASYYWNVNSLSEICSLHCLLMIQLSSHLYLFVFPNLLCPDSYLHPSSVRFYFFFPFCPSSYPHPIFLVCFVCHASIIPSLSVWNFHLTTAGHPLSNKSIALTLRVWVPFYMQSMVDSGDMVQPSCVS